MSNASNSLPPEVLDALDSGNTIEAIKLLRQSAGLGLKEAKDAIDAHQRGSAMVTALGNALGPLPASVIEALQSGNKVEAIKLMREHAGSGLKEAKDAVEAAGQVARTTPDMPSPGEVPKTGGFTWMAVGLAAAAVAAYYFFRNAG